MAAFWSPVSPGSCLGARVGLPLGPLGFTFRAWVSKCPVDAWRRYRIDALTRQRVDILPRPLILSRATMSEVKLGSCCPPPCAPLTATLSYAACARRPSSTNSANGSSQYVRALPPPPPQRLGPVIINILGDSKQQRYRYANSDFVVVVAADATPTKVHGYVLRHAPNTELICLQCEATFPPT